LNKKIQKYISYFLGLLVIFLLGWYLYDNQNIFGSLRNISWKHILEIISLDFAIFLVGSFLNYSMITRLDSRVGFLDCLMLQYINNLLNKILPTIGGGAAFRALYLKKKYQFPYPRFASSLAGYYVVSFVTTSSIGIICMFIFYMQRGVFNWVIFLVFMGLLLFSLYIILFSLKIPESNNRVIKFIKIFIEGWNVLKGEPKFLLLFSFCAVLLFTLSALQTLVSYQALGISTNFISMMFLSTLGLIVTLINFTPDGIGLKEGIYIFSASLVQIPDKILVLGSLVLRGVLLIPSLAISGFSYWFLMKQLQNPKFLDPIPEENLED
jgi:uncharacterized membrane protein YbhN (UPF0104 family)